MDKKILFMDKIFICQNHQWMEKSSPWIKVSSMEKTMDDFFIHVTYGWKESIKKMDDTHWRSHYELEPYTYLPYPIERRHCIKIWFFLSRTMVMFGQILSKYYKILGWIFFETDHSLPLNPLSNGVLIKHGVLFAWIRHIEIISKS